MKRFRFLAASLLTASTIALGVTGCGGGDMEMPQQEVKKAAVEAQEAGRDTIKSELVYAGEVKPNETVSVTSKISGQVSKVNYDVGDTVSAGEVMFTLDQKDIQDQIRQLQAQLNVSNASVNTARTQLSHVDGAANESQELTLKTAVTNAEKGLENAKTDLENAKIGIENSKIAVENAKAALETAKASLNNVTERYNNMKVLYNAGTVTKNDYDSAELAYTQAQKSYEQAQNSLTNSQNALTNAQNSLSQKENAVKTSETAYNQARENYRIYTNKTTGENRETAQAGVNSAVASRESVQTQISILRSTLNDTAVKAPISGVITAKNISETNMVSAQSAPFVIEDMSKVTVDVNVSEKLINVIKQGDKVDVTIDAAEGKNIQGRIKSITPSADTTKTYPVKIEIDNADGTIKPGMFAKIHFVESEKKGTIVVPRNTVLENETEKYVFVIEDGKAVKKTVETGIDNGDQIEIISGVDFGENIIVKGQSYVTDGDEVNVVNNSDNNDNDSGQNQNEEAPKEEQ